MRKRQTILKTMAVTLFLLAVFSSQTAWAISPPDLKLPTDPVTATYGPWLGGQNSTMDITLSDVGQGFDVQDGTYTGWCIQDFVLGSLRDETANLYSSYDPNKPDDVTSLPWNGINYVLNHKQGGVNDVQIAIWFLLGDPVPSSLGPVTPDAQAMIDAAQENPDFVPGPGQIVAVIVYSDGMGKDPSSLQETIIEVTVPEPMGFSLGDRVWYDQDQDGIQDANEPGYNGVTVDLYNNGTCVGAPIASTTTGAVGPDGFYEFTDLAAGDYCVQFGNVPTGWSISPADQGDGTNDSSANSSAQIPNIILTAHDPDEDMGIYVPGSLGDSVVCVSTGEGLANIGVSLFEDFDCDSVADGAAIATTETDATGFYQFSGLEVALAMPEANGPFSIWDDAVTPTNPSHPDTNAVELGVKFRADVDGYINGVRFYKGIDNTGTHIGNLWASGGGLLASATFVDETTSGWQQVNFAAPVAVSANTTYVASYHTEVGYYAVDSGYFADGGVDNPPLHALADGVDGGNGVYVYGPSAFPPHTYEESNYWVDVVFATTVAPVNQTCYIVEVDTADADLGTCNVPVPPTEYNPRLDSNNPNDPNNDFQFEEPPPGLGSIGDTVWQDNNGDGVQDAGEPGIPGVTVDLNDPGPDGVCGTDDDAFIASDVTDANGNYLFEDLPAGVYCVDPDETTVPAGYTLTTNNDPQTVDLGPGEDFLDADFGYQPPPELGSIGDTIWQDNDGDGVQDAGEPGIPGVTVDLNDPGPDGVCGTEDDAFIASDVTDANGNYLFGGLEADIYCVDPDESTVPDGYELTTANDPETVDLGPGEDFLDADFGYQPPPELGSIGDTVWQDNDGNGVQDAGEPGIPGVTVNLLGPGPDEMCNTGDEVVLDTTTTDADGIYGFWGLTSGTYCVQFVAPPGYIFSPPNQGDGTNDSKADPTTGQTGDVPLAPGENNPNQDAGLYQPASLGDFVWEDLNGDGIQDAGEPGIPEVTVNLLSPGPDGTCNTGDEVILGTTTTDANGFYGFAGLTPGDYCVEFVAPSGYLFSPPNQGTDPTRDSDADPATGRTGDINLVSGENDPSWDAGLYRSASLGDFVWEDENADGIQDFSEPGVPGMTVNLYDCEGNFIASTTTDAYGFYSFSGLASGDYYVEFVAPPGYDFTEPNQGDGTNDSKAEPSTGQTDCVSLVSGEVNNNQDAGLYQPASLGDFVWEDLNANGIQDAGEPGISEVAVNLLSPGLDGSCNTGDEVFLASDTTDANGMYGFAGLTPGDYCVEFVAPTAYVFSPPNQGTDDSVDSDADPATGQTGDINLVSGEDDPSWDAGLYQPAALGDYVWQDLNRNGIQDDGDTGINDVTVRLYNCAGDSVATAVTADDTAGVPGYYLFDGLAPGCYEIEFVSPVGYVFSPPNQGTDDALDSDADPATGRTGPVINLISGQTDLDWDAGLYLPMCDLLVNKACQLPPPPPTSFVCSDAKPIDELTMIWNGTQTVNVVAWKGSVGSSVVGTVENVAPGDVVTISGFAGSPNDVYWEIFEAASGVKMGESTFHLSCSDDDMNGPEDCGKPEGDGKGKTGFLNDWLFEGMAGNGQELICTPTPPALAEACEFVASPNPSCATLGKPTSLTFKYTGGGCAASDNTQDPGKAICTGSIDARLPVAVTTSNSGYTIDPTTVEPGREFTVSASGFDSNSIFQLTNAAGTETNQIHTSCSQPLQVGDVFGSLTLVAFNGQRAATEVTYFYEVFNNGDALSDVTLTDRVGGLPVFTAGPFDLAEGETRSFQSVAEVAETTTNVATFSGFLVDGGVCAASDEVTVSVVEPCDVCKGGTTDLTLRYLGTTTAEIVVYDDKDPKANEILFQGMVAPSEEFSFSQRAGQDKMDNDISVWVDGVRNTIIHTSCSQPIGPGLISGDFEIVEGRSKDNGLMCALDTCSPGAAPSIEFHDKEIKWNVTNNGDLGLEIERISITWPAANGDLDEVKRDGDVIHKGDFSLPSAVIDSGWEGNPDKRTIKPGETDTLKFKFKNNASLAGEYSIVVEFTYGCSVEVGYTPLVSGANFACDKPIDSLTMIWDGSSDIRVNAWKGNVGSSTLLASLVPVSVGGELTVSGYAGSPNDVYWEIFNASGAKLGESTFHLSCSDEDMNDALDCGKPQGDGKDKTGFLNDWILEGMVDAKTTLNCTAP